MAHRPMKYNPAFLDDEALIESFVSRHVDLELILETIRDNTGDANQHVLLIGPRGIGKTTLVLRVAAEIRAEDGLRERWYPLVFGEESYGVSTPGEFWLEALFHLSEQTQDERWQQAYEELRTERDEDRLRRRALIQLMDFADKHDKRLLLIVENLNMLVGAQMSSDDAWVLRHTLMNEPRLMLLGTATSRFEEVEDYDKALYDLFKLVELDPLDDGDTRALWASITGNTPSSQQIRPIQILTGGNPRLIRIISEFAADTSFRELMADLIHLVDEHTEYFKHHLDNLPVQERKVFVALADLWDPSTAREVAELARLDVNKTSALLRRLTDRGAVTVPYQRGRAKYYQVAERMYNVYHLMRRRGQATSRVQAVVRFMTHLYQDEQLVQTTRSLLEEANSLAPKQRREHLLAYQAILEGADEPALKQRLFEVTGHYLTAMPDAPPSVLRLIADLETEETEETAVTSEERASLLDLRVEQVDDTETLLKLAQALEEQPERQEEAEVAYRKVLEEEPQRSEVWYSLGKLLALQGRYSEALDAYDRAIKFGKNDYFAWLRKGFAFSRLGRYEEALDSFDQSLAFVEPELSEIVRRANASEAWSSSQPAQTAVTDVTRYKELLKEQGDVTRELKGVTLVARGLVLGLLGRHEEALDAHDQALALNETDASAWHEKGLSLYKLGRYEEALEAFEQSLEQSNHAPDALNVVACSLYESGWKKRFPDAEDWARRAVEQEPPNAHAQHTLAALLGAQDKWPEALSHARELLRDTDMVEAETNLVIDLFIDAAVAGHGDEALQLILASPSAELLEPLTVALQLRQGEEVDVAREIYEVARDVIDRIEARMEEMRQRTSEETAKE